MDRGHYNYGRPSGGASLVATINPNSSPNQSIGVKKHNNMLGSSILPNNIALGKDGGHSSTMPLGGSNKNSGVAQYTRGKQEMLQGLGGSIRMGDHQKQMHNSRGGFEHGAQQDSNGKYVSHSPQPYSKFKLQPTTKGNLMIYGQNGKPGEQMFMSGNGQANEQDSRNLNAPPHLSNSGRNGYPVSSFEKNNVGLTKNSAKNIEHFNKGAFVQQNNRRQAHSNNPTGPNGAKSMKVNQSGIMIGLPKVSKMHHDDRNGESSPTGKGNQSYQMMNSQTKMNPLKMPSLVDRSMQNSNEQGLPGAALPSLSRHQQQTYVNRSEFKQAYENHIGLNKVIGSNENSMGDNMRGSRRVANPNNSNNNTQQRDKDSRSHSTILPVNSGRGMPTYAEISQKAQQNLTQNQQQLYKSLERKQANEAASPASVTVGYHQNSAKAGRNAYMNVDENNNSGNGATLMKQHTGKQQRGNSSRNQGANAISTEIFQQQREQNQHANSNSPPNMRSNNLMKIHPGMLQQQQASNLNGINIRRQGPNQSVKNNSKKDKSLNQVNGSPEQQAQQQVPELIEQLAVKTRCGFIPQMRKTNQDSYCVQRELAGVPGLWMFGVMDGHGVNGHQASGFCKSVIPTILTHLIQGASAKDIVWQNNKIVNRNQKKVFNKQDFNNSGFLPNISGRAPAGRSNSNDAAGTNTKAIDADKWLSTDIKTRDRQIQDSFELCQDKLDVDSKIDVMFSGTTSVFCFLSNNNLVCANSGDSRGILCSVVNGQWKATALSRDHKPEDADEAARVKRSNGRIEQSRLQPGMSMPGLRTQAGMFYGPKRVWLKNKQVPGLAMTRSIGDMAATSVGVTAKPEVMYFPNLTQNDKILVMGSDGIWDRFSNNEIMQTIVNNYYANRDAEGACNYLVKESVERWTREQGMVDDITIIIAFLKVGNPANSSQFPQDQ